MDSAIFQKEDKKYSLLWANGYSDANWKRLAKYGWKLARSIKEKPSIVDFGFGRGSTMDFFQDKGLYVEGVEISQYAVEQQKGHRKVYHASLDKLEMLGDNQFNVGFCNDVIEHIPEEYVTSSLDEMARVCSDYLLMSVCPTPSHHLSLDGENLHLTVKPESWWENLFQNYGEVKRIKFRFSRSARYVIDLKSQAPIQK
jgi:hypothetical protein